ncbi:hypothetical protein Tco_0861869 [Tanacetum coccineum]
MDTGTDRVHKSREIAINGQHLVNCSHLSELTKGRTRWKQTNTQRAGFYIENKPKEGHSLPKSRIASLAIRVPLIDPTAKNENPMIEDIQWSRSKAQAEHLADVFSLFLLPNTNNTTIRSEGKLVHLEQPMTPLPYPIASQAARDAYEALNDAQNEVACLRLGSMSPELQKALENYRAYDMIQELKTMFEEQAKQELFEIVKAFYACK